jgi:hypothetical protein
VLAATVTICGPIATGTYFDPNKIAEAYWQLHQSKPADWQAEVMFK